MISIHARERVKLDFVDACIFFALKHLSTDTRKRIFLVGETNVKYEGHGDQGN